MCIPGPFAFDIWDTVHVGGSRNGHLSDALGTGTMKVWASWSISRTAGQEDVIRFCPEQFAAMKWASLRPSASAVARCGMS